MNQRQCELLEEARESVRAAKLLLQSGHPGYAASRAYYAMFYAASAFLEGQGLRFSSHSAVIAAFGPTFRPNRQSAERVSQVSSEGRGGPTQPACIALDVGRAPGPQADPLVGFGTLKRTGSAGQGAGARLRGAAPHLAE